MSAVARPPRMSTKRIKVLTIAPLVLGLVGAPGLRAPFTPAAPAGRLAPATGFLPVLEDFAAAEPAAGLAAGLGFAARRSFGPSSLSGEARFCPPRPPLCAL